MSHGYISEAVRARLREQARERCGYCLSVQQYVLGPLEIDHLIPQARGGTETEENLWLACRMCNGFKGTQTHARDPLTGRSCDPFPRNDAIASGMRG